MLGLRRIIPRLALLLRVLFLRSGFGGCLVHDYLDEGSAKLGDIRRIPPYTAYNYAALLLVTFAA
jgi:hypothetical protein